MSIARSTSGWPATIDGARGLDPAALNAQGHGTLAGHWYLIAIGSNRRSRHGGPRALIGHLSRRLRFSVPSRDGEGFARGGEAAESRGDIVALSRMIETPPLGPGTRRYANAVALIETMLDPPALLDALKAVERACGRRAGRRWGDRVLDLDIIGWSGGIWASKGLSIPHPAFRARAFVLKPLVEIAPGWRDPVTHRTARQLSARLDRARPRP